MSRGLVEQGPLKQKSIEENIRKARRAFFALGAVNVFQGSCNPLTSLSMFITFVEPILLYGCEIWFLTEPLTAIYVGQISGRNWKTYTSITKISQQYFCKGSLEMAQFHCAHFAQKTDVSGQVAD